ANKLKHSGAADEVSEYIRSQLSPKTEALLGSYKGGSDANLQQTLADDIDRLIYSGPLYEEKRFANVVLSPDTVAMLARKPEGADLARVNRMLLVDAYPDEVAPYRASRKGE